MEMASGLAAISALLMLGAAPAPSAETAAVSFAEADLVRRPIQFSAVAGDMAVDVLTARVGCRFEGPDGQTVRRVWLLSKGGEAVAVTPLRSFAVDPALTVGLGELRPPERPVLAPAHGLLPLSDGPTAFAARLKREAWRPDVQIALRCAPLVAPKPRRQLSAAQKIAALPFQAAGVIFFSPVILFGVPAENASLTAAAAEGPAVADALKPGQAVPRGVEAFARKNWKWVRVLADPGSDFVVLSIDLGGAPRYGVATHRDAVFFGVRDGIVEWRAGRDMGLESSLCTNAEGRFGRRFASRKGCTNTGYYSPRI